MLPLATTTWDDNEYNALNNVIKSGMFTMGKFVKEFEHDFAQYVGSKYAIMVNSGSSANLLAIASLFYTKLPMLQRGDEIIVPAVSWSTTYYPLYQYGLKIKFVDIDKETLNLDLDKLKSAITDKTRAIMSVNLLGNIVDYTELNKIIADKNIILIEDNCESLGSTLNEKHSGTFGLLGTYSCFFSHHISTMEGGMVTTDNEELYHIMLSLRAHGWTRNLPKENKICTKSDNPFEESFRFVLPGYNLRPLEMSGALGIEQLKKLPTLIAGRRLNARYFQENFSKIKSISIQKETGKSSWFGFSIIVFDGKEKRDLLAKKFTENGIECRPIVAGNFAKNPVVQYFDYEIFDDLKNSDLINDSGLFIGNHHYDIKNELKLVEKIINETL
ncbi:DegT/DnrJ/EryC1/StrS family aminotransferase [Morganella morganii]|uniref:DegT/DnrJ/EryC1/StrS family aminotransferase n=1 Tax=Morganella morganii TaxID=582 RepID=UPI00046A0EB1|nr:DegT/DnrJ/EryC1/StrS family aminotransferase [Morganella morganii]